MAIGDLRKKLLEKIKTGEEVPAEQVEEEVPVQIKNNDPTNFSKTPAWYHAKDRNVPTGAGKPFPKESILHKSVHERMKTFVKNNTQK